MHVPARARLVRVLMALSLVAAWLVPAAATATAADEARILRVGTTQNLDAINPFQTELVIGFEVFTLNYDLLVNFGPDVEPSPGFATAWDVSDDGLTWTFTIRDGMKWSDGTPATAEDAAFTWELIRNAPENTTGAGYLDPYLTGVTKAEATSPTTLVVTTEKPNPRLLATYIPILPKHIWGSLSYDQIGKDFTNDPPVVGTGPYQVVEWRTGQFARLEKNPNWWGGDLALDEVQFIFFDDEDAMGQALRTGSIDFAHGLLPDQYAAIDADPEIVGVSASANGWTQLGFNCYAKDIAGGGASTKALRDPAFRDALGYAIDKDALVKSVLKGYGTVGTTPVPPINTQYHVEPTSPRPFSIDTAKSKLEAAGYRDSNGDGTREDKEGKELKLRLYYPDSDTNYPGAAEFITEWFKEAGVALTSQVFDSDTLVSLMLPPEGDGKAEYDLFIWGWAGDPDPDTLLNIFTEEAIGSSSDSLWSHPDYERDYAAQRFEPDIAKRKPLVANLQQIVYREAPYHILYYDNNLQGYRTDKFDGWATQPTDGGTVLFAYGSLDYTKLRPVGEAGPSPGAPSPGASGQPSPGPTSPGSSDALPAVLIGAGLAIVVLVAAIMVYNNRQRARPEEE